ncbi:MAG: hypothetical protein HQL69_20840 [Magnetococcales bacterium]|nr:hypothetical protein [Magnetococcales bacterium]
MSYSVSLSAYVIRVKQKRSNNSLLLGQFDGVRNVRAIIKRYFEGIQRNRFVVDEVASKAVSVENIQEEGTLLRGVLRSSLYGYASNIIDINSGDISYSKKRRDADMIPFYWDFCLPERSNKGIMLVQSFGNMGIREQIRSHIETTFAAQFPEHILDIRPLVPENAVRKFFEDGEVHKLAFIRHTISSDYANQFLPGAGEREGEMELAFKPKDKYIFSHLEGLIRYFRGDCEIDEVFEFEGFEYDNIKAQIQVNGKIRTVSLSDPRKIASRFDVDRDLEKGLDGFPTFNSLKTVSRGIIVDLARSMEIML